MAKTLKREESLWKIIIVMLYNSHSQCRNLCNWNISRGIRSKTQKWCVLNQYVYFPISILIKQEFDIFDKCWGFFWSANSNNSMKLYIQFFTTQSQLLTPLEKNLLKTLWEKEKTLVTSIFSFSQNVFYHFQNKFQFSSCNYSIVCKFFEFGMV